MSVGNGIISLSFVTIKTSKSIVDTFKRFAKISVHINVRIKRGGYFGRNETGQFHYGMECYGG
jgi:hypothetical protein